MSDDEILDSLDRELLLGLCNRPADCPSCRERWSKIGALRRLRSLRGNHDTAEILADPDAMSAIEASKYTAEEDLIPHEEVKRQLGLADAHPPLTRERVAAAVGELMDGIRGATGGHEPFGRVWLTDRLCRLLGVIEE
jgi:hypothetical protein